MALVDRAGRMVRFSLKPGNAAENLELPDLLSGVEAGELIADKAYHSNAIQAMLAERGIVATIPPKKHRVNPPSYDVGSYKTRHRVENLFVDLKQFRSIATRYCKLGASYASFISLARWVIETRPTARPKTFVEPRHPVAYWQEGMLDLGLDYIPQQGTLIMAPG